MASTNTVETLNGHFKDVYADKIKDLIPEGVKLLNMIDFIEADKQGGNLYNVPVTMSLEHGFTYGGSGGRAFSLNQAIAASHENAQVRGHEMVLRSYLSIGAVSRSQNKNAFVQESKHVVQNMLKSFVRRLEVQLLYGQASGGIGVVDSVTGSDITIYLHEWAAGIWSGAEGMDIDVYTGSTLTAQLVVSSVDFDTNTITCTSSTAALSQDDVIFYGGAKANEFAGIHKILENSSTLFNIDASAFNLWKGNIVDVGTDATTNAAVLTFAKAEKAISRMMEKGLVEGKVSLLVNPKTWSNLLSEQDAKRKYDSSYSKEKAEAGHKEILFASQNGEIEVISSIFCKEGYAYVLSMDCFERIGSSDVRFDMPGFEGKFVKVLENVNAYEMRSYTDQALFCNAPGHNALLRYIKSDA